MAGRPRQFDKDQALKQAMLVFWEHGYEGTSMSVLVETLGIASARIYAAFGSKQRLFEEAVALYESQEGGFADQALALVDINQAIRQMLCSAVEAYTSKERPWGCLVVSAATSVAPENTPVLAWLAEHRRQRTQSIITRLEAAADAGQLGEAVNAQALGNFYAAFLHGISVQARDGVPKNVLLEAVDYSMGFLPLRSGAKA